MIFSATFLLAGVLGVLALIAIVVAAVKMGK